MRNLLTDHRAEKSMTYPLTAPDQTNSKEEPVRPSTFLAPLAEILEAPFHVDVSRDEAIVVQTETGHEFPLSLLSSGETDEIRERACDQYVQSVLTGRESIDQDRATLFFISRFCDRHSRVALQKGTVTNVRRSSRRATHPSRTGRYRERVTPLPVLSVS